MMSTSRARMDARAWSVLFVLAGAVFLEGIDVAMLNVALPAIRADLGLSTGMLSGVVSAYVLGYGGFMLLGGRVADVLGRRRMFLFWLTVFLVFSGLGGFATEGWMLLVARFVTGVAAAFMAPAGLALVTGNFPEGPLRTKALGVYAGTAAGGFSLGLVVGGLLASIGWRWVFFAPVLLSALILVAAVPLIKETAPSRPATGGFDLAGAFAITGAMLLLVYGVIRLEHPGDGVAGTVLTFAAGLALLAAFVVIERRSADPLVRLGILRSGPLVRANLGALLFVGSFAGFQFVATLYLQEVRGWSSLQTGLAMLVIGLDTILAPTLTPRLVNRFGNARVLFGGIVVAVVAYALFLPVGMDWTYTAMLPTMLLLGVAFSLAYGPLTMAATDGIAEHEQGLASGLLYTSIQFGTALGLSAVAAVAALGDATTAEARLGALQAALFVPLAAAVLGVLITAIGIRSRPRARSGEPEPALAG
ncbi:MFS transporter [Nonomuraea glycinis]|uniref:MFS transporter n=1 Tax=Nonomuraea glycinis TaxID=2047744 RepID=A0A918A3X0_9ACTN|nr:MFS transporter [Nonomuraea glycinis]MCA2177826.1 MFS transporter [Nonomuraea glycinis]GGP06616.1 MFS transporter [Nonomuraea glycinis]